MIRVLVADDDPNTEYLLQAFCRGRGDLRLEFVPDGATALGLVNAGGVDAVVADIRMPHMSGDELLSSIKKRHPTLPVLIMTSYGSISDAVDFLQRGADDYLAKPLTKDVFLHRLDRLTETVSLKSELTELREEVSRANQLIGASAPMLELANRLPTIAQTEASVVVYGESGTGKEVVARTIHALSRRSDRAFVTVNCGSLPETLLESELFGYKKGAFTDARTDTPGLVEEADGGTLFLDEIGEISGAVQVKLLRFIQLKEYKPLGSPKARIADVRIIVATNRDLRQAVADGDFREDLFYRLNIVPLTLPPLRERRGDITALAAHFLEQFNRRLSKTVEVSDPGVFRALERHRWPGNVRELENKIEQLAVMAVDGIIRPSDVQFEPLSGTVPALPQLRGGELGKFREEKKTLLESFERDYLERILVSESGHVSNAAKRAGLDRKNLWQLMKKHGIEAEQFKG